VRRRVPPRPGSISSSAGGHDDQQKKKNKKQKKLAGQSSRPTVALQIRETRALVVHAPR